MDGGTITGIIIGIVGVVIGGGYGQYQVNLAKKTDEKFETQNDHFKRFKDYVLGEINSIRNQQISLIGKKESAVTSLRIGQPSIVESELGSMSGSLEVMGQRLEDITANVSRYNLIKEFVKQS